MQLMAIRRLLTLLLLGSALAMPSLSLAEHLHDSVKDEITCETCSSHSTAVLENDRCTESIAPAKTRQVKERPRIPFEVFRLNNRTRGPPLR